MARQRVISVLFLLLTLAVLVGNAKAHFVYVYGEDGKAMVVFGEGLAPDQVKFLKGLSAAKAFTVVDGKSQPVTLEKKIDGDEGWFEVPLEGLGQSVNVACPYGVFNPGGVPLLLDYSAKFVRLSGVSSQMKAPSLTSPLSLDMVPQWDQGQLKVTVYFNGMPLQDAEVSLISADSESMDTTTDEVGTATLKPATRYVVRAKHAVAEAGEVDGVKFSEKRYYCTMVIDVEEASSNESDGIDTAASEGAGVKSSVSPQSNLRIEKVEQSHDEFPRGMTSFGAAVVGGKVFVVGGKSGRPHHYARSYQNREIFSFDFQEGSQWEVAGDTLGLQGLALVAEGDKIIRIGGLEVRSEESEEQELRSIAAVKSFDTKNKVWSKLPALPEGRSSIDAVLHQGKLYVVGGWKMTIGEDPQWATDMLMLDLSQDDPQWQSIEAPFETRAMASRASGNYLFAIGGIDSEDGPTDRVHVFDIQKGTWAQGPAVPCDGGMKAFGCSAVVIADTLLVSTYDGGIYGINVNEDDLSVSKMQWEKLHQLPIGRFFHQMVPVSESKFAVVGGANMEHGTRDEVEVFSVEKGQ